MDTGRMEAFSDGVLAIIITIMVLELKVPHGADVGALWPPLPVFLSYILSFIYLGIYWNNHHHMLQVTASVSGAILWANLHLLFWLSLIPFVTGWMGENSFAPAATALYGVILLIASFAYWLLQRTIIVDQGRNSVLAKAVGTASRYLPERPHLAHSTRSASSLPIRSLKMIAPLRGITNGRATRLQQPAHSEQRKHPLEDRRETDQHD